MASGNGGEACKHQKRSGADTQRSLPCHLQNGMEWIVMEWNDACHLNQGMKANEVAGMPICHHFLTPQPLRLNAGTTSVSRFCCKLAHPWGIAIKEATPLRCLPCRRVPAELLASSLLLLLPPPPPLHRLTWINSMA